MKKLRLLLILIVLSINLKAQISFMAPGATWHYIVGSGGWGSPYIETNETAQYIKDSLFMGKQSKVIANLSNFSTTCSALHDTTLIYTSNDSVFFHNNATLHTWELLYCFNISSGQKWTTCLKDFSSNLTDSIFTTVDSVRYKVINGFSLKTLYVSCLEKIEQTHQTITYQAVIYDRIGNLHYLLNFHNSSEAIADPCYDIYTLCYSDNTFSTYQIDAAKSCTYNTGINKETANNKINIYPNPASTFLQLEFNGNEILRGINLYDILGNKILTTEKEKIDVSNLQSGVYFIHIETNNGIFINKFVKE